MKRTLIAIFASLPLLVQASGKATNAINQMIETKVSVGIASSHVDEMDTTLSGFQLSGGLQWDNGVYGHWSHLNTDERIEVQSSAGNFIADAGIKITRFAIGKQMRISSSELWFSQLGLTKNSSRIGNLKATNEDFILSAGYKRLIGHRVVGTLSADYTDNEYQLNGEMQYTFERNIAAAFTVSLRDDLSTFGVNIIWFPSPR